MPRLPLQPAQDRLISGGILALQQERRRGGTGGDGGTTSSRFASAAADGYPVGREGHIMPKEGESSGKTEDSETGDLIVWATGVLD